MHYDPVKLALARLLKGRLLRRGFHLALDLLFLRAWWVRRELRNIKEERGKRKEKILDASPSSPPQGGGITHPLIPSFAHSLHILDAGMGFGQYSDRLARVFPEARVVGLEIDRAHLYGGEAYFRAVHPGFNFTLGDVQKLPFRDASFDLIVSVDVMEHIPDDRAAFGEYARALKPGGRLLMHTPRDKEERGKRKEEIESGARWVVGEHVRDGYKDEDAREKIEGAGFTIERMAHGYGRAGMVAWTLLQRVVMTMLGGSRLLLPVVALWLILVILPAILFMYIDCSVEDRPDGGSLLIVARKD